MWPQKEDTAKESPFKLTPEGALTKFIICDAYF